MNQVIINTKRKGFTKYNGKIGIFKEIVERTNVNGFFHIVEVECELLRLFQSDFEWLNNKDTISKNLEEEIKEIEGDLKNTFKKLSKKKKQETLNLLKKEYLKYTGFNQIILAQTICQLELM